MASGSGVAAAVALRGSSESRGLGKGMPRIAAKTVPAYDAATASMLPEFLQNLRDDRSDSVKVLDGIPLTIDYIDKMCDLLKRNISLEHLSLNRCSLGTIHAKSIADALSSKHIQLQSLYLQDNKIGAEGVMSIAESMKTNTSLNKLDLYATDATDDGERMDAIITLAQSLQSNKYLEHLDLSKNLITDYGEGKLST